MIKQAYKHLSLGLWPYLMFFKLKLKSLTYWNEVGGDWKRLSCHGNRFFYSPRCVSCRAISLRSFNSLCCKLAKIALFIYNVLIEYWVECMTSSVISFTRSPLPGACNSHHKPMQQHFYRPTSIFRYFSCEICQLQPTWARFGKDKTIQPHVNMSTLVSACDCKWSLRFLWWPEFEIMLN